MTSFFVKSVKMIQIADKPSVAVCCSIWWKKYFSDLNDKFLVNISQNATKQQLNLV